LKEKNYTVEKKEKKVWFKPWLWTQLWRNKSERWQLIELDYWATVRQTKSPRLNNMVGASCNREEIDDLEGRPRRREDTGAPTILDEWADRLQRRYWYSCSVDLTTSQTQSSASTGCECPQ